MISSAWQKSNSDCDFTRNSQTDAPHHSLGGSTGQNYTNSCVDWRPSTYFPPLPNPGVISETDHLARGGQGGSRWAPCAHLSNRSASRLRFTLASRCTVHHDFLQPLRHSSISEK